MHSTITGLTITSKVLNKTMRLRIYLPPLYGQFKMRYPVVYLLHPWGENEDYWLDWLRLHEIADHLIDAGALPPFIAIMPQGDKSFFIDAANPGGDYSPILRLDPEHFDGALEGYGDYGSYIMEDVISTVERAYQTRTDSAGRVIAGVSMGGTGAGVLAFTHPQRFGAVGIHSPTLFTVEQLGPPWIFGLGDEAAFAERDPVHLAQHLDPTSGLRIYIDCGHDDEMAGPAAALHGALSGCGIQHIYISRPGQHDGTYWKAHLAEYLGFYAAGW